jgi:hypothetical protein
MDWSFRGQSVRVEAKAHAVLEKEREPRHEAAKSMSKSSAKLRWNFSTMLKHMIMYSGYSTMPCPIPTTSTKILRWVQNDRSTQWRNNVTNKISSVVPVTKDMIR